MGYRNLDLDAQIKHQDVGRFHLNEAQVIVAKTILHNICVDLRMPLPENCNGKYDQHFDRVSAGNDDLNDIVNDEGCRLRGYSTCSRPNN